MQEECYLLFECVMTGQPVMADGLPCAASKLPLVNVHHSFSSIMVRPCCAVLCRAVQEVVAPVVAQHACALLGVLPRAQQLRLLQLLPALVVQNGGFSTVEGSGGG
jgi:hypothetical protein